MNEVITGKRKESPITRNRPTRQKATYLAPKHSNRTSNIQQPTKTAAPDGHVVNFGDSNRDEPRIPGERETHDCMVFDEASECLKDVEVTSINKAATMVEYTVLPFNSKHTGATVIGHNTTDAVVVKECGTIAINTFVHSIFLAG